MIIGALSGYAITTLDAWKVRDNLWAVGLLAALLIWIVLKNIDDIAISKLTGKDVVRHRLVQEIIKAYERSAEKNERKG